MVGRLACAGWQGKLPGGLGPWQCGRHCANGRLAASCSAAGLCTGVCPAVQGAGSRCVWGARRLQPRPGQPWMAGRASACLKMTCTAERSESCQSPTACRAQPSAGSRQSPGRRQSSERGTAARGTVSDSSQPVLGPAGAAAHSTASVHLHGATSWSPAGGTSSTGPQRGLHAQLLGFVASRPGRSGQQPDRRTSAEEGKGQGPGQRRAVHPEEQGQAPGHLAVAATARAVSTQPQSSLAGQAAVRT